MSKNYKYLLRGAVIILGAVFLFVGRGNLAQAVNFPFMGEGNLNEGKILNTNLQETAPNKAGRKLNEVVNSIDNLNNVDILESAMSSSRDTLSKEEISLVEKKLQTMTVEEYFKLLKIKNEKDKSLVQSKGKVVRNQDEFLEENGKFIEKLQNNSPKNKLFYQVKEEEIDALYKKVKSDNPDLIISLNEKSKKARQDSPFESYSEQSSPLLNFLGISTCLAGDYNCGLESFPIHIQAEQKWGSYYVAPWSDKIRNSTNEECDYRLIFSGPHAWKSVDGYDTSWDWLMVYWPPASLHGVGSSGPDGGHIIVGRNRAHATGHTSAYVVRWSVILRTW